MRDEDPVKSLHIEVADLVRQKKTDKEIINFLIAKGLEEYYATTVLNNVKEEKNDRKNFSKTLIYGIAFLLLGIMLNFASWYFAVSMGSFFYILFWGVVVAGLTIIARAFILFRR
jgi:hypothetical protein